MKLGVVGHAQEKFTEETERLARSAIDAQIGILRPKALVSGHSPMGGVDLYAEDAAKDWNLEMIIHEPAIPRWDAPGGFRDRNLAIARDSDVVLVVVVQELPPGFGGMRFDSCYHCKGRTPAHVKSGGCWTAWQCDGGRVWAIVREDGFVDAFVGEGGGL